MYITNPRDPDDSIAFLFNTTDEEVFEFQNDSMISRIKDTLDEYFTLATLIKSPEPLSRHLKDFSQMLGFETTYVGFEIPKKNRTKRYERFLINRLKVSVGSYLDFLKCYKTSGSIQRILQSFLIRIG